MNEKAFSEMLGVIDDAIETADDAVKVAELAGSSPDRNQPVKLIKVASDRYKSVASTLMKTGSFREYSPEGLTRSLESAGTAGLLEFLEKLASRAVFPIDADFLGIEGDLVDKSATSRTDAPSNESKTDLWARCCHEVGLS